MSDQSVTANPASADPSGLQIAPPEVAEALSERLGDIKLAEKEAEAAAGAELAGLAYAHLAGAVILPDAIGLIPEATARERRVLCYDRRENALKLATTNPEGAAAFADIIAHLEKEGYTVTVAFVSEHSFTKALEGYKTVPKVKSIQRGVSISKDDLASFQGKFGSLQELADRLRTVSTTDVITFMVASALESRASDIHIEAAETDIVVRYRIDGILHEVAKLPRESWEKLDSRIKLLAGLKINVTAKPQDGEFRITRENDHIDVRVSAIPTNYGESIVLRLLMSSATAINFDDLGLRGKAYADLDREIRKPNGMIITTGPTGSGKTTTLYAILNRLNDEETKIITLEDPIEYKMEGINQSQVKTDEGYTFSKGLRSILRQDPDVIMVGEIRDLDTADTAINAALTGHLVISTLHTNSASATLPRLLSMGVKPFLLAPAINAMIGQRLVRRICEACKEPVQLDSRTASEVIGILSKLTPESGEHNRVTDVNNLVFYRGKGCEACQGLGYRGRIGIYEIVTMSKQIEELLLSSQVSEYQMAELAAKNGVVSMVQDGLLKALDGLTTVDEVFRVAKDTATEDTPESETTKKE